MSEKWRAMLTMNVDGERIHCQAFEPSEGNTVIEWRHPDTIGLPLFARPYEFEDFIQPFITVTALRAPRGSQG